MSHPIVTNPSTDLSVTLNERRRFAPEASFVAGARVNPARYERWLEQGRQDPEGYWADAARELEWSRPFKRGLEWESETARVSWFADGELNASVNCLDRHLKEHGARTAIVFEGEPVVVGEAETVRWSYAELHRETVRLCAALRGLGLKPGDRVGIYLPLVPESVAAMLACARAGLTHTVIFGGFSSEALKDRLNDCGARALITADYGWRKGARVDLAAQASGAIAGVSTLEHCITLAREQVGQLDYPTRPSSQPRRQRGRVREWDWHELVGSVAARGAGEVATLGAPEWVGAEHPLFVLYTSGTTGKPKGLVHSTGGYLTGVSRTTELVLDLKPTDVYWCTADIGWITGHSYVVYGPLAQGATVVLYEGAPTHPGPDRLWQIIERHRVSVLYTAPTAIRALMRLGDALPRARNLKSLRLLGTVGEPINPEAWMWYRDVIGGGRCPIVDTFWQTETGAIVVSPVPGVTTTKPGSATRPLPGYAVDVVDRSGRSVALGSGGLLVIRQPWPSMARTIQGDHERYRKTYFSEFPLTAEGAIYFTGDGARRDEDGDIWCLGRVDDVLNVSGHRLGTMEIESALVSHPTVAEAAVVGRPDELKGQAVVAFVTLKTAAQVEGPAIDELKQALKAHVVREIGALARPEEIRLAQSLPKTRSGKIMRRLLRELATHGVVRGDTTTLEDLGAVAALQASDDEA